jgi:hypothetical protein
VLSGDFNKLNHMSGHMRNLISCSIEIFEGLLKGLEGGNDFDRGFNMGRATFEVGSFFVPWGAAFKVVQVGGKVSKAKFLSELGGISKFFQSGKPAAALEQAKNGVGKSLQTLGGCFIAGTLVHGAVLENESIDIRPIERIEQNDYVWAEDTATGGQRKCRVIAVHRNQSDHWHQVSIDIDGDGQADEELTGTATHPFWNPEEQTWVNMGDLRPGKAVKTRNGSTAAYVLSNQRQNAPPGELFTTYNFEVEGLHTYLVGNAGILVHNDCKNKDLIVSKFHEAARRLGKETGDLKEVRFKALLDTKKGLLGKVDDANWRESAKEVSAKMLDDFADGKILGPDGLPDVSKLPTVKEWNEQFFKGISKGSYLDDVEVHHIVPEKLTEQLKSRGILPNNFSVNAVPGHAYTKEIHRALHDGPNGLNSLLRSDAFERLSPEDMMGAVITRYREKGFTTLADVCEAWLSKNITL